MINFVKVIHLNAGLFTQSIRQMAHKVFVYGTLKRNEPNHHWLTLKENGNSKFIAEGSTKTKYPLIIGTRYNIPFLLPSPGKGHNVQGEIYEVDDLMLSKLDILEDHPNYYVREKDDILVKKGNVTETVQCWVYFLQKFRPELLQRPMLENYSSKGPHGLVYKESNGVETVNCWIYFLHKFRPELLGLPMLESYSSTGPHGLVYVIVAKQDRKYDSRPEVKTS